MTRKELAEELTIFVAELRARRARGFKDMPLDVVLTLFAQQLKTAAEKPPQAAASGPAPALFTNQQSFGAPTVGRSTSPIAPDTKR